MTPEEIAAEAAKTAELEAEKKAAEGPAGEAPGDTTGGEGEGDESPEGAEKKDYSQMSEEQIMADLKEKHKDKSPEELLLEVAKQSKIISHKNRAITSLKKPKEEEKPVEKKEEIEDLDKPITRRDLLASERKNTIKVMAEKFTTDEKERKAIIDAYENDIVKSGDPALDFNKASAIANQGAVQEYKKNQAASKQNENFLTDFSAGNPGGGEAGGGAPNDAVKKATAANLEKAGYSKEEVDKVISKM